MRTTIAALLAVLPGCIIEVHGGDGVPATEVRAVGAFDAIANEVSLDVDITYGETPSVTVTCDENLLENIVARVDGSTLVITTERSDGFWIQLDPRTPCGVSVITPTLVSLSSYGSGDVEVLGPTGFALQEVLATGSGDVVIRPLLSTERFDGLATGSGALIVNELLAETVSLTSTGSGGLSVSGGSAGFLELVGSGSGDLEARGLVAQVVDATLSGSGDGEVTASEAITASLSGSGDLRVWGSPAQRDVNSTGSGEVRFAE